MGGGLMQLVAYGAQDVYLSGSPQITFFKVVYRRHTNFSVEPIPQPWNGAADFGRVVYANINRNGDLITNMYVAVELAASTPSDLRPWGYVARLGNALIAETKVEIGGSKIDEQYGDWLNIWYELTHKIGQERGYAKMIGDVAELKRIDANEKPYYQLYVPLQYWFNRNNGLALPLIALQYHDVRITVQFRNAVDVINYAQTAPLASELPTMQDCYLLIDYVYLDSEERKRFAQASHEYLIEQVQFTGSESLPALSNKYRLNFNHPSKYLIWTPKLERFNERNNWVVYADNGDWEAAKELFAKTVWVASRAGINASGTSIIATGDASGNELSNPGFNTDLSGTLLGDAAIKVNAQLLFLDASGSAAVNPDNVILLDSTVTVEDMSYTIAQLLSGAGATTDSNVENALLRLGVNVVDYFNYGNYVDGTDNPCVAAKLQLNGHDRFQERDGAYFNYVQPYQHFPNTPADGINVYSFALNAAEHQPSGTCNFSRIDNATLNITLGQTNQAGNGTYLTNFVGGNSSNSNLNIWTVNYNVLRVMSGMAGVAYAN